MRMAVSMPLRTVLAVLLLCLSTACSADSGEPGCESRYLDVVSASTWTELRDTMLAYDGERAVASVRIQALGDDLVPGRGQKVKKVVDLLDRRGRRVAQVDVWQTPEGGWGAGRWGQCID